MYLLKDYLNKFIAVYFNNIIVFSKDSKLYNSYIWNIIDKFIKARIILKIKKCEFDITIIKYLEIIYLIEGLQILLEKINIIINWPILIDVIRV